MIDRYKKNTYIQNKGQCKDKSMSQKVHIFSCTAMIVKHLTLTFRFILTYCQLIQFTVRSFALCLPSDQ